MAKETTAIMVHLPTDLADKLKERRESHGISVTFQITKAVADYLGEELKDGEPYKDDDS